MFHPITSLVSSVECVFANTCTFSSASWSQLNIEVSSVIFAVCRVLLDCSVQFFDVVVRISRVGELNAHQFDAMVVYHDRGSDGPFVDVFGVDNFLPLVILLRLSFFMLF